MTAELHPSLDARTYLLPSLASAFPALGDELRAHGLSPSAWASFYAHADPVHSFVLLLLFFATWVYVAQQITGNSSQVDRLWTFLPVIFTGHFALHTVFSNLGQAETIWSRIGAVDDTPFVHPRLGLILVLTSLWSARLTYNAYRRGMFKSGEEDYRWALLKRNMNAWQWQLFSIFFISIAQIALLGTTGLPAYLLLTTTFPEEAKHKHLLARPVEQLSWADLGLTVVFLANLATQALSDHEQWVYQNYKRNQDSHEQPFTTETKKQTEDATGLTEFDAKRGFNANHLFAWSRHPNFACEQNNWWIQYLYVPLTFISVGQPWSWRQLFTYAAISPLNMNMLFAASTNFTERVTASKYPAYAAYQARVDMFWPTPLRAWLLTRFRGAAYVQKLDDEIWGKKGSPSEQQPLLDNSLTASSYGAEQETPTFG